MSASVITPGPSAALHAENINHFHDHSHVKGPTPGHSVSTDRDEHPQTVLARTLDVFNQAIRSQQPGSVANLFHEDGYWRDHLASSWDLRTLHGKSQIRDFLGKSLSITSLTEGTGNDFRKARFGPLDGISGDEGITALVAFQSTLGQGRGTIRLSRAGQAWKISTLFLSLEEIAGVKEPVGPSRVRGNHDGADAEDRNWKERRSDDFNYKDKEPTVVVIGGGQAGLTVSARLKMLGVDTLAIDMNENIGDNWRRRYKQLVLHDPVWYDHMPYMKFPPHWPVFTPKDKLADWFETYVSALELNVWTKTRLISSEWNEASGTWTVELERSREDGSKERRTFHPRHIIQATGHSGKKNMPSIKGVSSDDSRVCHSSDFSGVPESGYGKQAIVVGACNSGHDIAKSLYEHGYDVTMVQRSTTCVISSSAVTNIGLKGLYDEDGPPVEDADLTLWGTPFGLLKLQQAKITKVQAQHDAEMRKGLETAGFKLDDGPEEAGLICKYFTRGGGYYIDVGASKLIAEGKIKVKQGQEIDELSSEGLRFADGTIINADKIVFATGYQNMRTQTRAIFGDELADRVSDVWGFDSEGEFRTIFRKTGHPGFWYFGGNLAICRYYSKVLAMQIKAAELTK